jgi:hypothetical protein
MRFAVSGWGWPVNGGATLIPPSTIVDTSLPQWAFVPLAGGVPPPYGIIALDQATYNAMVARYGFQRVLYGPDVVPTQP